MDPLTFLLPLGIALWAFVTVDVLWSTLWLDGGAGPLATRLSSVLWTIHRAVIGRDNDRVLSLSGPIIITGVTMTWVMLLWAAWWCIYSSNPGSLQHVSNFTHPDAWERFYFIGSVMFTLGGGEWAPTSTRWRMVTNACGATGMALITMTISFVVAVISAAVDKRALASSVSVLGNDAHEIVETFWRGDRFEGIEVALDALAGRISDVAEEHLAYPMLHAFHSASDYCATPPRLAALYDALLILELGVDDSVERPTWAIAAARRSLDTFYGTIAGRWQSSSGDSPPLPSLARLNTPGLALVDQATFAARAERHDETRQRMAGLLQREARDMPGAEQHRETAGAH